MIKNLITKQDITKLKKEKSLSARDARIVAESDWSESKIQQTCKRIIENRYPSFFDNRTKRSPEFVKKAINNLGYCIIFQQNDNGGRAIKFGGKLRKHDEGTISGWPDITIWAIYNGKHSNYLIDWKQTTLLIEFKRIGGKLSENQEKCINLLEFCNQKVFLCNNTVYFEHVICKEIDKIINQ